MTTPPQTGGGQGGPSGSAGAAPSFHGLHCAAPLMTRDGAIAAVVVFGGAAQDGQMSDEAFALDVASWS